MDMAPLLEFSSAYVLFPVFSASRAAAGPSMTSSCLYSWDWL